MNSRLTTLSLLAVCIALMGIIGYLIHLIRISPPTIRYVTETKVVTNTVRQIAVRKINATNLLAALTNRAQLHWSAVESTNYHVYIENLRGLGCPEETIRDIILTDVAKLYAKRRAELRATARPYKFWQTGETWGDYSLPADIRAQLLAMDREQRALVRELLGVDFQTEMAKYWDTNPYQEHQYDFLPAEKRTQLLELQAAFEELEQAIYLRSEGLMLEEDEAQLRALQKQKEAEMAKLLTPEEMEEYQLRFSDIAQNLRTQLSGFDPSEEEFRNIFRLQKTFENEFNQLFDPANEAQMEIRLRAQEEAQQSLKEEMKKVLGEKRYAEYERGQDADYQMLVKVAERFELPREVAGKVYEMKLEAERQKLRLESNPNLTEEQRQAALAAIARETEKATAQAMGETVFKTYWRSGAQWIRDLSVPVDTLPLETEPLQ